MYDPYQATKTPKGAGQLVLYLDFDSVLHHEIVLWHPKKGAYVSAAPQYKLFQHADLPEQLLEPNPNIKDRAQHFLGAILRLRRHGQATA